MLWVCLRFPSLPLDVFARAWSPAESARPFVVASGGHYPRVVAANPSARDAGVRCDQLISAALALAPGIVLRDRAVDAEAEALSELATWALNFTPNTSLAAPDAVLAEIGGSLTLFGGLPRLAARLATGAQGHGYATHLGVAPTPTAALLLARSRVSKPVLDLHDLPAALAPLRLKWLDLDPRTLDTLAAAGVETFGAVAALPRDGLARRFGAEIVATLDRALGRIPDARLPHLLPSHFARRLTLPAPATDTQALGFAASRLVHELSSWLNARGLGVIRLSLELGHERYLRERGMPATVVPFALGAPARAAAHLNGVLRERLARVALPAPVETVRLRSEDTAPLPGRNRSLLPTDEAEAGEVPLIDRLRARLGDAAVMLLMPQSEHRPELAGVESADAQHDSPRTQRNHAPRAIAGVQSVRVPGSSVKPASKAKTIKPSYPLPAAPRPIWLLSEAQPLGHLLEQKPWILRDGPERIESGWWDGRDFRRDYFVAESPQGELLWIYRDHRYGTDDGEWFLQGVFA